MNFDLLKQEISLHQVCASYGLELKKSGGKLFACCPFHLEKTPSFYIYPDNHFHCFGCGKHGSVLDFVAFSEHCDIHEAGRRLCETFNPGLLDADDNAVAKAVKRRKEREAKVAHQEKDALVIAVRNLCSKLRDEGNDMAAQSFEAALANDIYSCDELYSCLFHNQEEATANQILSAYHSEYFENKPKQERGRPAKEKLCRESLEQWLKDNGIVVRRNVLTKSAAVSGLENERLSEDLEESQVPIIIHDKIKFEYSCSLGNVEDLLGVVAGANEFNPVLDLLSNSPPWDGVDRLKTVYDALHLSEEDTLSRSLIKKWFIQCISLQYNSKKTPFGAEGVLVLNGAQNTGKTSCIRKLALHELKDGYLTGVFRDGIGCFKEGMMLSDDKDSVAQDTNAWIIELGEVSGTMNKSDENFLKNFITRFADEYRVPYGHSSSSYPRRTSIFGTVNDPEFLVDPTGSRRWWVIPITQRIDLDALDTLDKIQFWKQIETYSDADRQSFRLTLDEVEELSHRNTAFEKPIPAVEEIRDIIAASDACPQNHKWVPTTISLFKDYYPVLSRYSTAVLSKAIKFIQERDKRIVDSLSVPQNKIEEYGLKSRKGRFITLPYPKKAFIYSSPSEVPPEDKPSFAADVAKEVLKQ